MECIENHFLSQRPLPRQGAGKQDTVAMTPPLHRPVRGARPGLLPIALTALAACSDSQLYRGSDVAFQNDRLALTGRFCSVDPAQQKFPVKILFLIDTSTTMQALDPDYNYARAVNDVIERYANSRLGNYSFGIIGYGGRARLLSAGLDNESFTRRPDLLQNAIQLLRLPEPCVGTRCRDLQAGLSLAASLVTGDVLAQRKGEVARTRYIIVNLASGPPIPRVMKCQCAMAQDPMCVTPDKDCELETYRRQLQAMVDQVQLAGAKELRYHTFYLRDTALVPPPRHDEGVELLQRLAATGNGAFQCVSAPAQADCDKTYPAPRSADGQVQYDACKRLNVSCPQGVTSFLGYSLESAQRPFLIKKLLVANLNVLATIDGPRVDSDGDGLSDDEEVTLGSDPTLSDTDGDGVSDMVETRLALSPLSPDPAPAACYGIDFAGLPARPLLDTDGDLLNDCEERLLGTDLTLADTDGDGLPDGLELRAGTNYLEPDYLIPPYDHDGVDNGDEVRQHTAPRLDDSMDARGHAYFYDEQYEGVKSLPYGTQPRDITGVQVLDVSAGATAGVGSLRYLAAPLDCDATFPGPRDPAREADHERCRTCPTCAAVRWRDAGDCDYGPAVLIDVDAVRLSGGVSLTLDSRSVGGVCTVPGQPMPATMSDFRIVVRIENAAVLRKTSLDETIVVGTALRACERYQVRNVTLLTPEPDQTPGREESKRGMNNVYVYFGQAPEGQLTAPSIYSTALIRVRYAPPARRDPGDAEIVLRQEDFVVLGEN